ncbi:MAG: hypothetical protein LBV80_02065 [Deltaproteobacteria bacterium]|nr:hypothetical protein [Deltaproteobacteria bacterium]
MTSASEHGNNQAADLVILSARPDFWEQHLPALRAGGLKILLTDSYEKTAAAAKQGSLRLVLIDLPYSFDSLGDSVRRVQAMRPGLQAAVVSHFDSDDRAEALQGLNVFLTLPRHPDEMDIKVLLNKLR